MTGLLVAVAGVFLAYALYIGSLSARYSRGPRDFLDAGMAAPAWAAIFGGGAIILSGLNLHDHLLLVSAYGLQASHVAVGLALAALTGAVVRKRLWLAARMTGLRTVGDIADTYYSSVAIRLVFLGVLLLFCLPLAAYWLSEVGDLVERGTAGAIPRGTAIWSVSFFLFLPSVVGGWRASVYIVGALGFLLFVLLTFAVMATAVSLDSLAFITSTIRIEPGVLPDRIPGVIQFSAGIGKGTSFGGVWTTVAILSFALSLIGIALYPGFGFLGITTDTRRGFAFEQVWMTTGLAAGALLFLGPVLGAELPDAGFAGLTERLSALAPMIGVAFVVLMAGSLLIGVAFLVTSGAHVATYELIHRYLLPDLDDRGLRLAARIALAVAWVAAAFAASVTPLSAAIIGGLALPIAAQLLLAYLGLCWLPWISRSGVLTGFVVGALLVIFTEPFGLIAFERLFLDLPWGRWPLTIHSAAWGLTFNVAFCLLVSLFTRKGPERTRRDALHDAFAAQDRTDFGGRASRGAKWSLTLLWTFLALGPGAILGNSFFSQPVFSGAEVTLGLPSLLVWQLVFWLLGVLLVWWLAYQTAMSIIGNAAPRPLHLGDDAEPAFAVRRPPWISRFLDRVGGRG